MHGDRTSADGDAETLALLIDGDARGLDRLLADHGGLVRAYLVKHFHRRLRDWQLAEAIALAMIRVWETAPRLDLSRSTLRAWFAAIAHSRAVLLVSLGAGGEVVPVEGVHPATPGLWTSPADVQRMRFLVDVDRSLMQLESIECTILSRDLDAGATLPAAVHAQRLGLTTKVVETARGCGRRKLRRMLEALGYGEKKAGVPTATNPRTRGRSR